jgi:hypothetical protein
VKLPKDLNCLQCVLQWKYRAGNNWGTENGFAGLGYGAQEEFYNCADIAIGKFDLFTTSSTTKPTIPTTTTKTTATTTKTTSRSITTIVTTTKFFTVSYDYRDLRYILCEVDDNWKDYDGMYEYCVKVCSDPDRDCKFLIV